MRAVHLSTDDVTGGAARCAARVHEGLRRIGVASWMVVERRRGGAAGIQGYAGASGRWSRFRVARRRREIRREIAAYDRTRPEGYEPFNSDRGPFGQELLHSLPDMDVLNLHWVARFVDMADLIDWLPADLPVVWTLHDMHLLTGGCHYDDGCGRFVTGCGACPQLGSSDEEDLAHQVWSRKRRLFHDMDPGRVTIVTPSRWLADEASRSGVIPGHFPVRVIPYGLDTDVFSPRDRDESRAAMQLPRDARVVLFAAQSVENRRKGFGFLLEALEQLDVQGDVWLVSLGAGEPDLGGTARHVHMGFVQDDEHMARLYSAADVFVMSSLQDNLPATVLESLACGTPVAGFDVGGVPDMVRPGLTGELAPPQSGVELARAIERVLASDPAPIRERCRAVSVSEYGLLRQAEDYEALYASLISGEAASQVPGDDVRREVVEPAPPPVNGTLSAAAQGMT